MKIFVQILLFCLPLMLFSQKRLLIGLEIGPKFDIYKSDNKSENIDIKPILGTAIYGLNITYELNRKYSLQTGIIINDIIASYTLTNNSNFSYSYWNDGMRAYQIPLRFNYQLYVTKKLKLIPTLGYHLGINSDFGSWGSSSFSLNQFPTQNISLSASHDSNSNFVRFFSSVEAGLSLNYSFSSFDIFIKSNYLHGFNKIFELDIEYDIQGLPPSEAKIYTNGNLISHVIGFGIPLNNNTPKPSKKLKEGVILPER